MSRRSSNELKKQSRKGCMHKSRVRTLQALILGSSALATSPLMPHIQAEFAEVHAVRKIRRANRRRLLEVLHSTRALDTTLSAFVGFHGCRNPKSTGLPKSLGQYLNALHFHQSAGLRTITALQRSHFQKQIVDPRNRYMHEAGAYPTADVELQSLLSEMDTCLSVVLRL